MVHANAGIHGEPRRRPPSVLHVARVVLSSNPIADQLRAVQQLTMERHQRTGGRQHQLLGHEAAVHPRDVVAGDAAFDVQAPLQFVRARRVPDESRGIERHRQFGVRLCRVTVVGESIAAISPFPTSRPPDRTVL